MFAVSLDLIDQRFGNRLYRLIVWYDIERQVYLYIFYIYIYLSYLSLQNTISYFSLLSLSFLSSPHRRHRSPTAPPLTQPLAPQLQHRTACQQTPVPSRPSLANPPANSHIQFPVLHVASKNGYSHVWGAALYFFDIGEFRPGVTLPRIVDFYLAREAEDVLPDSLGVFG